MFTPQRAMKWVPWFALLLAACRPPIGTDVNDAHSEADTGADSGLDSGRDSAEDSGTDSGTDTAGGTTDSSSLAVDIDFGGVSYVIGCDEASGADFVHTYDDALGNAAGRVTCATSTQGEFVFTFTSGGVGSWTDPSAGVNFVWSGPAGERLAHSEGALVARSWQVEVTRFDRLDTRTIEIESVFHALYEDGSGAQVGELTGQFAVRLGCTNCP